MANSALFTRAMNLRKLIKEAVLQAGEPYIDQFGDVREVTKNSFGWNMPKETFESRVKSHLVDIIMEENQISEKNFNGVEQAQREVRRFFEHSDTARAALSELKEQHVRYKYAAESIYRQWGTLNKLHDDDGLASRLNEENKSKESKLKDNKVKLTDEERTKIITSGATWDDGKPGIWKSVDDKGVVHYCSNTHRAMAVSTTLDAAIKKFPAIKSSS